MLIQAVDGVAKILPARVMLPEMYQPDSRHLDSEMAIVGRLRARTSGNCSESKFLLKCHGFVISLLI